jgi:flavin reductase (DIM6/NTAB) family NADH-FMN oxidoreductase RutF
MKIDPGDITVQKLHSYLLSAVAPRPIAFASTVDKLGNPNLSPFSFFNVFGANPPILIFSPSRRGRDNTLKNTFENVKEVPEVVISMVTYAMVQQVSLASNEFPKGVNEFQKAGFHTLPSGLIKPFRIKESPVNFECKVIQVIETGDGPGAGNLVVCEVLRMHIDDKVLDKNGLIDIEKLDLVARMGGDYYCRASGGALFKVEKPGSVPSIGIDSLPENVRNSKVLSGNDLGILGSFSTLPSSEELNNILFVPDIRQVLDDQSSGIPLSQTRLHTFAKKLIREGRVREALCLLMIK